MAHFRKINVCIWNDEKFQSLSTEGKLAFFYLITHPQMTALGAMRASINGLADELQVLPEAFREVLAKGFAIANEKANCMYVVNFLKYQTPESPNVVRAWEKCLHLIPECSLKNRAIADSKALTEGMSKAFQEAWRQAIGNKEKGERRKEKGEINPAIKTNQALGIAAKNAELDSVEGLFAGGQDA